ncbi:MAG: PIN domain-containing protein [Rickettsiaceae bacterium]|nr:MAG: PIN domain-containing protein [Rickettsiaceae bacterium]
MNSLVLDCSFIMSSVMPDEQRPFIEYSNFNIYVPTVFYLECNNVLLSAINKNRINIADYKQYIETLRSLPINVDKFSSMPESMHFIAQLALANKLTIYDASYLELATRMSAKIATFDKQLQVAASKNNIDLVNC